MGWATKQDVLRHHRILTRGEALTRQIILAISAGGFVALLYFISEGLSIVLTACSAAYLAYIALDLLLSTGKLNEKAEDIFRRVFKKKDPPVSDKTNGAGTNDTKSGTEKGSDGDNKESSTAPGPSEKKKENQNQLIPKKLCTAPGMQGLLKAIFSLTGSFIITKTVFALPWSFTFSMLLIMNAGASFLICTSVLYWIEAKEIDDFPATTKEKLMLGFFKKLSYSRGYYFIGEVEGKKIGLSRMSRFMHTLIGAPTGEGKSSSLIIPPLLFDADSIGSAVVPDAKSPELFNWVAGRWYQKGKKIFLFDPWHPDTIGINFLPESDDQDLLTVVEVLMREREEAIGKEDPFFKSRTRYLLYAILKLVQSFKEEYCTMSTVYKVVESVDVMEKFIKSADGEVHALFADFNNLYAETKVNALTSIREKLDIFMDEDVRRAFSKSEFKLSMLFREKEPCLLVLGAPIDKKEPGTKIASLIVNLVINMAFKERRLQKQAVQRGERSFIPNDLYLYLDELRNLKITALADLVSIARETKTHVIGSATDIGFFKYYREDFSSLMGNFRTRVFMRGMDNDSCKYISDSLGKENIITYKYMRGIMASQEQRNLLDPDKIMNLPEDKLIVFSPKTKPFIADKISIYKTKWLQKLQVSPPKDMRNVYKKWDMAKEALTDPQLPTLKGHYDMEAMKSGKPVKVNKQITVDTFFREQGRGVFRKKISSEVEEIEGETIPVSDDVEIAASNIDL